MRKPLRWAVLGGVGCVVVAGAGIALSGTASADELTATFARSSQWDDGYVAGYVVHNGGSTAKTGWTVVFSLPSGDHVTGLWNGVLTQQGNRFTVHNDDWNATLGPGSSTDFGFQVQGTGGDTPNSCTIDDQNCGGGTAPSQPVASPTRSAPPVSTTTRQAPPPRTTTPPTGAAPPPAAGSFGAFAPYADLSLFPLYDLAGAARATGGRFFNLAFVTDGGNNCTPRWGGVTALNDPSIAADISSLRAAGGDVRVSFGGASGSELELNCSSAQALAAAYQSVIDSVHATRIDFDVEGAALGNTAANDRRNQAIATLERNNASLSVSYTLPVLPSGLTQDGVNLLQSAKTNGATVTAVNVMAMDYGNSFPADMGQNAIDAATAVQATVKSVWGLSDADAWHHIAVTPMIGVNDVNTETFTTADASRLVAFAQGKHLAWLSFWSAARDQQCAGGAQGFASPTCSGIVQQPNAFAKIFATYTG
ncbi:MAG TPA: cellulose binding domain-containing protein [Pseudonocardiaceae bacterium]|jgi:hypothetical protein